MFGRRKNQTPEQEAPVTQEFDPASLGPRDRGPWDSSERDPGSPGYVDLGSLRIKGRDGVGLQLPQENGALSSVLVVLEGANSAMELRIFAASRSGGEWADVLQDLKREVERRDGEWKETDGPFGDELRFRVQVQTQDGRTGTQDSRILAVEGPRWLLRATLLGAAAGDEAAAEPLLELLRDVIVVRGDEPRMVREPLPLQLPPGAAPQDQQPPNDAG